MALEVSMSSYVSIYLMALEAAKNNRERHTHCRQTQTLEPGTQWPLGGLIVSS